MCALFWFAGPVSRSTLFTSSEPRLGKIAVFTLEKRSGVVGSWQRRQLTEAAEVDINFSLCIPSLLQVLLAFSGGHASSSMVQQVQEVATRD